MLIALLIALVIFALVVWIISIIPLPPNAVWLRTVLWIVAGLALVIWLWQYMPRK